MKKFFIILVFLLTLSTTIVLGSGDNFFSGDNSFELVENGLEILSQLAGENIMIDNENVLAEGTANDLLILAGSNVASNAIGSYGFMAAETLNVSGDILKDTFAAGNNINLIGNVGRDAYLFGTKININGTVGRNVYACGNEIIISGSISGDVKIAGNSVRITSDSIIRGNVKIDATQIRIENNASIIGIVTYNGDAENVSIPNNVVSSAINSTNNDVVYSKNIIVDKIKEFILWLFINIILFIFTMLICPKFFEKIEKTYEEKGGALYATSLGWGIILIIVIPIISIISLITVIGSALGFVGLLAYTVIMVYATVITGYLLGKTMFSNSHINKYLIGIIGVAAIQILRILPVIGGFFSIIIALIAFGLVKEIMKK